MRQNRLEGAAFVHLDANIDVHGREMLLVLLQKARQGM